MISKTALKSSPVSDEVHFAFGLEKAKGRAWIMPVLLEQACDPAEIHWQLPRRQYKDLTGRDGIAEFEAMLNGLSAGAERACVRSRRACRGERGRQLGRLYFCVSQACNAADDVAPPITQGRPNSTCPAAAAAMQPIASAPSPTLPHSETSRR